MEQKLYELFQQTPAFVGNGVYWRGGTANNTIAFRSLINNSINIQGFTINLQKQILRWGGIHRFRQNDLVVPAINYLESNNSINLQTANAISSYSKLFAFYNPNKYFIMDARVCYVYNKLIIANGLNNFTPINFDINKSRNTNLKNKYNRIMLAWPGNKINVQDAYPDYCNFIVSTYSFFISNNAQIFNNRNFLKDCPELIEMFLFYMADFI